VTAELNIRLEDPVLQKEFDDIFANPTSTAEQQLLNL
jgi:hypothetical protein